MNEPRKRRARSKAAAMVVAGAVLAQTAADPIAKPPLTPIEIRANTERTWERIEDLPEGDLLLPYQQASIAAIYQHEVLVIEKSRRIGLTWALASDAAVTASTAKGEGGDDVLYISYSQEMTREFVDACGMWARAFMGVTPETGEFLFDDQIEGSDETRQIKAFRIKFASGFEIVALSSAPRSLRGKQGKVIIDEAAFVDSLDALLTAALALTIWGSRIIVVSTHNGQDNPFNLLVENIKSGEQLGGHIRIDFQQAVADGLYERIMLVKGETATAEGKAAWVEKIYGIYRGRSDEELDCIPSAGKGAFISPELIMQATKAEAGKPELYTGKVSAIGWDVARRLHLSVIAPFEEVGALLILREQIEMRGLSFKEQNERFDYAMKRYRGRAKVDQTGLGMAVVESAQERHGTFAVEGVMFTAAVKLVLATLLKKRFEECTIWIPDDPAVRADLRSIKKSGKGTGAPIFEADVPAEKKGDDAPPAEQSHGDRFWAYALAVAVAEEGLGVIAFVAEARATGSAFIGGVDRATRMDVGFGIVEPELSDFTGY